MAIVKKNPGKFPNLMEDNLPICYFFETNKNNSLIFEKCALKNVMLRVFKPTFLKVGKKKNCQ